MLNPSHFSEFRDLTRLHSQCRSKEHTLTSISHAVHRSVSVRKSNGQSSLSMIPDSAADTTPAHGDCTVQASVSHSPHPQSRESGRRPIFLAAFRPLHSNETSSPQILEPRQLLVETTFDPLKSSERVNGLELEGSGELLRGEKYTWRVSLSKSERPSLPEQVPATFSKYQGWREQCKVPFGKLFQG